MAKKGVALKRNAAKATAPKDAPQSAKKSTNIKRSVVQKATGVKRSLAKKAAAPKAAAKPAAKAVAPKVAKAAPSSEGVSASAESAIATPLVKRGTEHRMRASDALSRKQKAVARKAAEKAVAKPKVAKPKIAKPKVAKPKVAKEKAGRMQLGTPAQRPVPGVIVQSARMSSDPPSKHLPKVVKNSARLQLAGVEDPERNEQNASRSVMTQSRNFAKTPEATGNSKVASSSCGGASSSRRGASCSFGGFTWDGMAEPPAPSTTLGGSSSKQPAP